MAAPEGITIVVVPSCDQCQNRRLGTHQILLEMEPGRDGVPWYLCVYCWFDGLHPQDPAQMAQGAKISGVVDVPSPRVETVLAPPAAKSPARKRAQR